MVFAYNNYLLLGGCLFVATLGAANAAMVEKDRLEQYYLRNYTWPPSYYIPDTPGWQNLFEHRFRQISEIEKNTKRYEAYLQNVNAAYVAPNFTEYGFGLARAPENLMEALREGIRNGLDEGEYHLERSVEVIEGTDLPWFIDRPDLTQRVSSGVVCHVVWYGDVCFEWGIDPCFLIIGYIPLLTTYFTQVLEELQHYPETWVGRELTPALAYGFRLYRNNSQLQMHVDRSQTHVISFILHIDSSEDAEPWPLVIEDFHGSKYCTVL
jgi:hypothetical protein